MSGIMSKERSRVVLLLTAILWPVVSITTSLANQAESPANLEQPTEQLPTGEPPFIDLAGTWQVQLAEGDQGWHQVDLPGTLRDSGIGNPVGPDTRWIADSRERVWNQPEYSPYRTEADFRMPFWLQPDRHTVGFATYRRDVTIPASWAGKRILLILERPHWRAMVRVDDQLVGESDSLSAPHQHDLSQWLTPGNHRLSITIDNSIDVVDVGINSHSVSDHTQSAWHGMVGDLQLEAHPPVAIDRVAIHPRPDQQQLRTQLQLVNIKSNAVDRTLQIELHQHGTLLAKTTTELRVSPGESVYEQVIALENEPKRWDEFHPELCQLTVTLAANETNGGTDVSKRTETFGYRTVTTKGTSLAVNGRPIFLRGTLECCIFPLTGYPPTDVDAWRRIIRVCKEHGLNHIRFHSWCPPKAAFVAADELGFYYQVECSSWPNQSTRLGEGEPIDDWIYREAERVVAAYGNHPSFILFCAGNEPAGKNRGGDFLTDWVQRFDQQDDRFLVSAGAGWPLIPANQYHVSPTPRIQQWGQGLRSRINGQPPETRTDYRDYVTGYDVPVIAHEIGQWCVYPNFDEIDKYQGALKPKNFAIFRDFLDGAGMLTQARDFLMASGKLQVMAYKEEVEAALRTPGFGGFQLLDLRDFPGQGTALVGMLDPFWDSKPYMTPEQFRSFCGPVIPLARMDRRVFHSGDEFTADLELSHFGAESISGEATWQLAAHDRVIASGVVQMSQLQPGSLHPLGHIQTTVTSIDKAEKLTLRVSVPTNDGVATNQWALWVYPNEPLPAPQAEAVQIVQDVETAIAKASDGGTVMLLADHRMVKTDVALGMSPIFWNTSWTEGQPPHTLGILCDPEHPALANFPTEYHSNWQWWELISRSATMQLDSFPNGFKPVIQVVPDWFKPRKLALVWEARLGQGKILVSSIDLVSDLDQRPVARQMLASLTRYVSSKAFDPKAEVTAAEITGLFREPTLMQRLGAKATASSAQPGYEADQAIDGNIKTLWHCRWSPAADSPHWIAIEVRKPVAMRGLKVTARQDMARTRISKYEVQVSEDGKTWTTAAEGRLPEGPNAAEILFDQPVTARSVRLMARDGLAEEEPLLASVAEIDFLLAD